MTRTALKVSTDGKITELDLDAPEGSLKVLQNGVGGWIELVRLNKFDMYVNENGKNNRLPSNTVATLLYTGEVGDTYENIVGDVVFVGGIDEEGDTTGLSAEAQTLIQDIVEGYTVEGL